MSDGFVWSSQDETCQVHLDRHPDYVVLSTHICDRSHAHMSLRMSVEDFVTLAHMMGRLANEMTEEWGWSSDA